MEAFHIRKQASLPLSQPDSTHQPGRLRRRLSSLSLNLSHPLPRFPRSNSISAMGEQAGSSLREWWGWGWSWILSKKLIFAGDLEMNKEEARVLGSQNRGSLMHAFFKLRSEIRRILGSSSDTVGLPLTRNYGQR